jgi:S1-C subfamily serine protease
MPEPPLGKRGAPPGLAPGFKLDVQSLGPNHLSFSKADLNRGLQDPRAGNAMGRASAAAGGGLTLDEVAPGTLADRLGLRTGDVLHSANGQALNTLTDLPRLYQEFGSAASVRLEVTRDGQPTILQYTVRP